MKNWDITVWYKIYICKYMAKYQYDSYVLVSNTKATFTMSNYGVNFKTRIFLESEFRYPRSWYQDRSENID